MFVALAISYSLCSWESEVVIRFVSMVFAVQVEHYGSSEITRLCLNYLTGTVEWMIEYQWLRECQFYSLI